MSFHILRGFFKTIINYLRQIRKLKERYKFKNQFSNLFLISKGSTKDQSVFRMEISFITLFKLENLSILGYFV
jgi:hypothetical protein